MAAFKTGNGTDFMISEDPAADTGDMSARSEQPIKPQGGTRYTEIDRGEYELVVTTPTPSATRMRRTHSTEKARKWYRPLSSFFGKISILWVDSWAAEALSCSLAVIALVCLIATLQYFDGYIITQTPLKISINTLVAIYAGTIKTSLLLPVAEGISQLKWEWFSRRRPLIHFESFDTASRGPWGSLLLLFRLRTRHLAALGAWITLLALAIDPFTQQIIRPLSSEAGLTQVLLEPGMVSAIYAGLLGNVELTQVGCLTGNCTFNSPPASEVSYQTLGIGAACVDVTKEAKLVEHPTITESPTATWHIPRLGNTTVGTVVNMYVNHAFANAVSTTTYANHQTKARFPEYWTPSSISNPSIYTFAALMVTVDWTQPNPVLHPFATECRLFPTVQTIHSNIEMAKVIETVLSSIPLRNGGVTQYPYLHISDEVLRNGSWESCAPSSAMSVSTPVPVFNNYIWDKKFALEVPDVMDWYAEDCVWIVDDTCGYGLLPFLDNLFAEKSMKTYVAAQLPKTSDNQFWLEKLYNNGTANVATVEAYMKQIANSMTVYTRQRTEKLSEKWGFVQGNVVKTDTCIQVQWVWVAFPASLVVLTIAFLIMTVWKTARHSSTTSANGAWKSSSLTVLFGGMDEEVRQKYGQIDKKSEMIKIAEELNVRLTPEEGGWRLSENGKDKALDGADREVNEDT